MEGLMAKKAIRIEATGQDLRRKRAADGTAHGEQIPGSRFFRSFCRRCGDPLRLDMESIVMQETDGVYCEECDPSRMDVGAETDWRTLLQRG